MIEELRPLADALSAPAATVEGIVARLGGNAEDREANVDVDAPGLDGFARASVVREADRDDVALVVLYPHEPLALGALAAELGEPGAVGVHDEELVYPRRLGRVTLIASADGRRLTLRPD